MSFMQCTMLNFIFQDKCIQTSDHSLTYIAKRSKILYNVLENLEGKTSQ